MNINELTGKDRQIVENRIAKIADKGFYNIFEKLINCVTEEEALLINDIFKNGSKEDKAIFSKYLVDSFMDKSIFEEGE